MTRTKKAVGILWWGMVSLAFGQKATAPPETFRLSYADGDWTRLAINQNAVYRQDVKIAATDNTPAREIRQNQNIGFELELNRLSKNADGSLEVEVTYRRKWRETLRDGEAATAADYSSLPGKKMTFRLLPNGEMKDLKGFESMPEIIDPSTGRPIDNSDFAADVGHLFPKLPDRPVSIGSTWEASDYVSPNSPRGQEPPVYRYQILGRLKKNGEDCLKIVSWRSAKGSVERPAQDGGTQQVNTDSGRIDVFYYSPKKGMFVAKSISIQNNSKAQKGNRIISESTLLAMYECSVTFN